MVRGTSPSILFLDTQPDVQTDHVSMPSFFPDLNLDQAVAFITEGREEYDLAPFFSLPLSSEDAVTFRHEVVDDLGDPTLRNAVESFGERMRAVRTSLTHSDTVSYKYEKERWFADAVSLYCGAVQSIANDLTSANIDSRGFRALREYLTDYVTSVSFVDLVAETTQLLDELSRVKYSLNIKGDRITVTDYDGEPDYSADVMATFERFKDGAAKSYLLAFPDHPDMNHVEAAVVDMVAKLNPAVFQRLDEHRVQHDGFLDPTIMRFDREVQFYLAYLELIDRLESVGLTFCVPRVSGRSKEVRARGAFDVVLANKLVAESSEVVRNDFFLRGEERIIVVTGPNNGGKTTFARTFGQLHYVASLGLPVPGVDAQLFLFDQIFTHFEKQEDPTSQRGKLEDELLRIHDIIDQATARSVVILNEIFTSTTLADALYLGSKVLRKVMDLDALCVCVTFVDELADLGPSTVSMVSTVDAADPAVRTFQVVRRPADGLAYAAALAKKYGLSYGQLKERIAS